MPELNVLLPVISIIIAVMSSVGVVIGFLGNKSKGLSDVQNNTIVALQAQNDAQEKQIVTLEKKVVRLESVLATLQITLKRRRGITIAIDGDLITLIDKTGAEHTVQIQTGALAQVNQEDNP